MMRSFAKPNSSPTSTICLTLDLRLAIFAQSNQGSEEKGAGGLNMKLRSLALVYAIAAAVVHGSTALAADKLPFIYTARVMSQAYPWIAQEAGLFKKYDLEVPLIFVTAGAPAVATILAGDSEVTQQGVQALRQFGLDSRDVNYIQAGGAPETLAALVAQGIDAAVLTVPTDAQALKLGYHYVVYGPDLKIAYAATTFNTRRSIMAKRGPV